MAWQWRFEDAHGKAMALQAVATALEALALDLPANDVADAARAGFDSQGDAETWIGLSWRQLLDAGVAQVVLLQDSKEVYGPMSLMP
ncbi:hypothetical protein [Streptacidiphilus rugosus]|uniref:hypothetical protein n=1 Tax=Streptacidiphilus rugosus TaxID=405783 RepID=UPI00056887C6|nr:hypothetical protein [Streptacidiphilus rugosus]